MGQIINKSLNIFNSKNSKKKILIFGLDYAGKTTLLYKLDRHTRSNYVNIGLNVEEGQYGDFEFLSIDTDLGRSNSRTRKLAIRYYYINSDAMIYVIDSNDIDRIEDVIEDFQYLVSEDYIKDIPILVLANKQDLENSLTPNQITDLLKIGNLVSKPWLVQGTSFIKEKGIDEGFKWLSTQIK